MKRIKNIILVIILSIVISGCACGHGGGRYGGRGRGGDGGHHADVALGVLGAVIIAGTLISISTPPQQCLARGEWRYDRWGNQYWLQYRNPVRVSCR